MAQTIQIKRGTGSAVPSGLADGELAINLDTGQLYFGSGSTSVNDFSFGEITAEKYIVSSSVLYVTTSFSSGSTEFGDTADDTHTFTGAITASGNISASDYVYADRFYSNGQIAFSNDGTSIVLGNDNTYPIRIGKQVNPILIMGHITASGNISSSGNLYAKLSLNLGNTSILDYSPHASLRLGYNNDTSGISIGRTGVTTGGILLDANVTSSGNISSSGTIFTDTISSPANNLAISSSTVTITSTTDNEANLILESDTDNNDENDNPFMSFKQDGGAIEGQIGLSGDADKWPDGTTLTGVTANAMVIGMSGDATSTNRQLFLAAGNTASIKIYNTANIYTYQNLTVGGTLYSENSAIYHNYQSDPMASHNFDNHNFRGEVIKMFNNTTVPGAIYTITGSGWSLADSASGASASGSLAMAVGTNSGTDGMMFQGFVKSFYTPQNAQTGSILYLESPGSCSANVSATSGHYVRTIGHWIGPNAYNQVIYFNPSNDWIKIS
jgi:hypothetical protein